MTQRPCWRPWTTAALLAAALHSPALAQESSLVPPVQLPDRNPINLTSREVPAVQGPGAFTTADTASGRNAAAQPSFWDRCHNQWISCKDCLNRRVIGEPEQGVVPLGTFVNAAIHVQIVNGEAACMCLHRYDFMDGTSQLNPHGLAQVAKIRTLLPRNFSPVVIEATGVPQIDDARRMRAFEQLTASGFPIPYERVVCGPIDAGSLNAVEGEVINQNLMAHTQVKGNVDTSAGLSFTSGSSGGGGGGGGGH